MGQLEDMAMFARVVESGGISKAAEQMNIAKSAVSRRLTDLEKRLGTQLLNRTTRSSSLTEAGLLFFERAQNILDEVNELNEQVCGNKAQVEGTLKMSAPLSFGLMHLSPLIDEYVKAHGNLGFQVDFTDRHIDLIEEGIELAIRIGNLTDSSYQARRLTQIKHVLCASPDYLQQHGTPEYPEALAEHVFLQYGFVSEAKIHLTDKRGEQHLIPIQSKVRANNGDFLKTMAVKGHGVCWLPTFIIYEALRDGELTPLLCDYALPEMYAYAVYPKNRFLPQRCRLFIDFLAAKLGEVPYWDC